MMLSLLYWLLPLGFILFLSYRIWGENRQKLFKRLAIWFCIISCGALVLRGSEIYNGVTNKESKYEFTTSKTTKNETSNVVNCPTSITPQKCIEIINTNIEDAAGIFHDNDFKRTKREKGYIFERKKYLSEISKDVIELAQSFKDSTGKLWYGINNRKIYEGFFNYLKTLEYDSLDLNEYKKFNSALNGEYPIFKYKNCAFIKRGFDIAKEMYVIKIMKVELLKEQNNPIRDKPKKNIVDTVRKKVFHLKRDDGSDYIVE